MEVLTETSPRRHVGEEENPGDGFDRLFFAHAGRLARLASLLGAADPEDVVQEVFARVFAGRSRLTGNAGGYLTRAVVNEVRDRHRRSAVARRRAHLLVIPEAAPDALDVGDRSAVLAAIAETMGVRTGTVKSQISRGLAALHAALTDQEVQR